MEESYTEFINKIKKVKGPRHHSITNSIGIHDAMTYYRNNRPKESKFVLSPGEYYNIIRSINKRLGETLLKGTSIKLPYRMGSLYIQKKTREPKLDINGKLIYRAPIDWHSTLKLWYDSQEDYLNKTILKTTDKIVYKFIYDKRLVQYQNHTVTQFNPTRELKHKLKQLVKRQSLDGYTLKY